MFEGSGFGVGLTVNQLDVPGWPGAEVVPADPGWHPTRLGELMPVAARSGAALAEETRRANIADSRLWAYRVELIVELAYRRRDDRDRPAGTRGAASPSWSGTTSLPEGVSEFFPDEVAMIMNCSRGEATTLTAVAWTLKHQLTDTWGRWPTASWAGPGPRDRPGDRPAPAGARSARRARRRGGGAAAGRGAVRRPAEVLVRTEVVRHDAEAADRRRRQAEAAADVFLRRSGLDGMTEVVNVAQAVAAAMYRTVDECARQAKADGDPRPIGQIRAEVSAAMTLRPWDDSRPPVTAELRVLAPLNSLLPDPADPDAGGRPTGVAEVEGEPITAAHLRAAHRARRCLPRRAAGPTGGSLHLDLLGAGGGLLATLTRRELEQAVRRGCPQHPEGDCRCPVVDRPPPTTRYGHRCPAPVGRARDHGCRHPGCRNQAGWVDLDHVVPHAEGGATDCDNLCCLCRRHHRLKTHSSG